MREYKGYSAKVLLDDEQGVFHGEVLGIADVVTFQGKTPKELTRAFHESVDDYLAFCKERKEEPERPCSGRFVVRVAPDLHRRIALAAKKADRSMNDWIVEALQDALAERSATETPLHPVRKAKVPPSPSRRMAEPRSPKRLNAGSKRGRA